MELLFYQGCRCSWDVTVRLRMLRCSVELFHRRTTRLEVSATFQLFLELSIGHCLAIRDRSAAFTPATLDASPLAVCWELSPTRKRIPPGLPLWDCGIHSWRGAGPRFPVRASTFSPSLGLPLLVFCNIPILSVLCDLPGIGSVHLGWETNKHTL